MVLSVTVVGHKTELIVSQAMRPYDGYSNWYGHLSAPMAFQPVKQVRQAIVLGKKRSLERAAGIEPASLAWKARVLPLHNARDLLRRLFHQRFEVKMNTCDLREKRQSNVFAVIQSLKGKIACPSDGR